MLIVFIYAYWCPIQFPYQIMFVSFNNTTTDVTCEAGTANPSGAHECTAGFCRGSCCSIFSFMRCGSLFVLLLLFCWPLYCLFCFDLRFWLPFCIFANEFNFDETTIRFNSVVKQRIFFYFKNEKKIIVLNWFTMKFIDWNRTGEML
jgi:hypothetical protein